MLNLKFKTMYKNEVTAEFEISNDVVIRAEVYCDAIHKAIFCTPPYDMEYLDELIKYRCFEECNAAKDFYLERMGVPYYDPWLIVQKTHGYMLNDCKWLLFEGESLTWEELDYDRRGKYIGG